MKMSDVFELPVECREARTEDGKGHLAEFCIEEDAKAAAHAINQHDEFVEVLTELVTAPDYCSEGYRDSLRKAKQLLEKEHDY